jgi:hypothetical protein
MVIVVIEWLSLLRRHRGHLLFLVVLALVLLGSHWKTPSNRIFSVTSINIPVYMKSPASDPFNETCVTVQWRGTMLELLVATYNDYVSIIYHYYGPQ